MVKHAEVAVIGAGVIGLTVAVHLAEQGIAVLVLADQIPGGTSLAAGALWGPYLVEPKDRVRKWAARSLTVFDGLAAAGAPGVRLVFGVEASRDAAVPTPDFADLLADIRTIDPSGLPAGFATGVGYTVPLIDMPPYLEYLTQRLTGAGGRIEQRHLHSLAEAFERAPAVVNCSGIGAAALGDDAVYPIRGQLVVVDNPGIDSWFSEDTGASPELLHWYPHGSTLVLGGLAASESWDIQPDPAISAAILARCAEAEPLLRDVRILDERAGLRPTRPEIRLQAELLHQGTVIHCYGHGGAGATLSWGCAHEVAEMITS